MHFWKSMMLVLLLFISGVVAAQQDNFSTKDRKAINHYNEADKLFRKRQFNEGLEQLHKAVDRDPNFAEAHLLLGNTYKIMMDQENYKRHYEKYVALKPDSREATPLRMLLGELSILDGKYEEAVAYFDVVLADRNIRPEMAHRIKRHQATVEFASKAMKNPLPIKPILLSEPLNKFPMQYFPTLTADNQLLIFTAREGTEREDEENIYVSKQENGKWSTPESISTNINSKANEGTSTISADGKVLVFTNCDRGKGLGSCDLFISYRTGDEWSKPLNLGPNVNSSFWDSQPSLSADGRMLFFTSDRPGGYGKRDIWISTMDENDQWQKAVNAGAKINTTEEDLAPFIHVNGRTLFFSSTGHVGMGGYDLFYTERKNEDWAEPKNVGYPLNTHMDDVGLFITADSKKGYYSIEKRHDKKQAFSLLYEFDVPEQLKIEHKAAYVAGKVFDEETKAPLGAVVELSDLASGKTVQKVKADPVNGEYLIILTEGSRYALYVNKPGYLFKSLYFDYQKQQSSNSIKKDIPLSVIKPGMSTVLNNLFFDSGKYNLLPESVTELEKLIAFLKNNPEVKIEIAGHTDNVGSDKDNLLLSNNRAMTVYTFLLKHNIAKDRIRYKGYGKSNPIAPNDSDENRQLNRRIEFRII